MTMTAGPVLEESPTAAGETMVAALAGQARQVSAAARPAGRMNWDIVMAFLGLGCG